MNDAISNAAPSMIRPQFGLRTVLFIMVAFAVPLALWRSGRGDWICVTFFAGIFLLFAVVPVSAAALSLLERSNSASARRAFAGAQTVLRRMLLAHGLLLVSFVVTAAGLLTYESYVQHRLERQLQRELGFTYRREFYNLVPLANEYAAVAGIAPGGVFERAGFQSDDIILHKSELAALFQMLDQRRGQSVELTVIRPLATQPLLENCPRLVLTVEVPP